MKLRFHKELRGRYVLILGVLAVLYALWTTAHVAIGFVEVKTVHVFPTTATADGWENVTNALSSEVPSNGPFGSFNKQNSAYVLITGVTSAPAPSTASEQLVAPLPPAVTAPSVPAPPVSPPLTPPAPFSNPTASPLLQTPDTQEPPANLPVPQITVLAPTTTEATTTVGTQLITSSTTLNASTSDATLLTAPSSTVPVAPIPDVLPVPNITPVDQGATTTSATSTDTSMRAGQNFLSELEYAAGFIAGRIVPTAFATSSSTSTIDMLNASTTVQNSPTGLASSSTTSTMPGTTSAQASSDTSTCSVLQTPCHTLELSGFTVSGSLVDKLFRDVSLNFSFGNITTDSVTDGKLQVRYYHAGAWHSAGEIYLNKELSNATNGGYFTAKLDELHAWDDLSDVRVVFEYVAGGAGASTQLYLDGAWLDVSYSERIQEVLNGDANQVPSDTPDNVSFDLAPANDHARTLVLDNGQHIDFPYVDDLSDSLKLRLDKQEYASQSGLTTAIISVTNVDKGNDTFRLFASLPGAVGQIREIAQYMQNVPVATTTVQKNDETYSCAEGWAQGATGYSCASTKQTFSCASLDQSGNVCLVRDTVMASSTAYVSAWVPVTLATGTSTDTDVTNALPPGYEIAGATDKPLEILPGQTLYFKVTMQTPDTLAARFVLSAKGNTYFGDADSLRLKNEASWLLESKAQSKHIERARVNDQLSTKTDFDVNQLPAFHFKFKTQRDFFTRLKDFFLRSTPQYKVKDAVLRHVSGETEHVPVDIEYSENNEWTLKLEKMPRAFRPGKYSIELTMQEGEQHFADSIDFYWGVLALNSDKSVYEPGETAHFSIAALDDNGDTMCDAPLSLTVTSPSGIATDVPVVSGGGCAHNNVTTLPDYVADYASQEEGAYTVTLSHLNDSGEIINESTDTFSVQKDAPFSVIRTGPTRVYPPSPYTMRFTIVPKQAFKGTITEILPEGFTVIDSGGATVARADGVISLTYDVDLQAGQVTTLSYVYKVPDVSPYLYLSGPLSFKADGVEVFKEGRAWKTAADSLSIATGVAWLNGTTISTGSTNLNVAGATPLAWTTDDFDTTYFSHSTTTNNSLLTVNVAGDYLVAVDVPIDRADTSTGRTTLETEIRVNGGKRNAGVGRAFIRTSGGHRSSSSHLYMLLRNLNAGDTIESDVHNITTDTTDPITTGTQQASMYAEYIDTTQSVYFAVGTTTAGGTNINPAALSTMYWYDDTTGRSDANYSHSNSSSPDTITLASAGDYMVYVNIPDSGAVTNASPVGRVLLNGVMVPGGSFRQGYIDNNTGATDASIHWSGVVHATSSNSTLKVSVLQDAAAGTLTVNNDQASLYVQKLPASGVYFGRSNSLLSGTNWNPAAAVAAQWTTDDINDASVFTHSTTTNSHQITVQTAGDYLVALNDSHTGAVTRSNEITAIAVNGTAKSGAQAKSHFIRNNGGHTNSSGSLVYLLRNLAANDVITITTIQDAAAGTITEADDALLMLWHKAAQSPYLQDTERWYVNANTQTPTDPWPVGAVDLNEGDPITTGFPVKSGDVLRLRIALEANINTSTSTDSFKLQYAPGATCSAALAWQDVGAAGSGSIWRAYDNPGVAAGSTLSSTLLSVSSTTETYEESNPSATAPHSITANTEGEWDWAFQNNGAAAGTSYCFRMVTASGQALKDYLDYPQLITNATPIVPTLVNPFDNIKTASTTPVFDFTSSDENNDNIHYEIQVSTDPNFSSTFIDEDSASNFSKFSNTRNPADKAPFASGQTVRYTPTATLTNGTTYWWRVRAKDPNGTNAWSAYSVAQSLTIDTSVTVSTWFQTTQAQFNNDTLSQVQANAGTDDVTLSGANTTGTIYSQPIFFSYVSIGNSWGTASSTDVRTGGTLTYHIEYFTATSSWNLIPDSDLAGNSAGFTNLPIALSQLDPGVYSEIRLRADFTKTSASPSIKDWTLQWTLAVNEPTPNKPFDNEKVSTTTPTFEFVTTDPQNDKLVYQIQWSTDATFASGVTTRTSDTNPGFSDIASTTATSPFISGDTIHFTVQNADRLASSTTYWWRVRAKDPGGGNAYSLWSTSESITTDTTVQVSTWFQTTTDQFNNDTLTRTSAVADDVTASSDTGKIAIYSAASAGEALTTAVFKNGWDTTVRQDSIYSLTGTTTINLLKAGYYAVLYGDKFSSTSGTNRSDVQSNLNLGGSNLSIGWSQGIIRRSGTATNAITSGGGIIKVASDNTPLILQSFRTDANPTATVARATNASAIQVIKLDSAWPYVRLGRATKQSGPTSANWIKVNYDREDEVNTTSFAHSTGSGSITLKTPGHYLVFANTYGSLASGVTNDSMIDQKLVLDTQDIEGSFSTVYIPSNTNGNAIYQGAASIGTIIQSTTSNQVLTVQVRRSAGTSAWTIDSSAGTYVDRTGVTVVKLPEADFIRLQSSTRQNLNPAALTALTWDTEAEKDGSWSHSNVTNPSRLIATTTGDYLFLTGNYAATSSATVAQFLQGWTKNGGALNLFGQAIGLNDTTVTAVGAWSGVIFPSVAVNDYFEVVTQLLNVTANTFDFHKNVTGVRIGSLVEADTNPKTIQSSDIIFANGTGPKWSSFSWSDAKPAGTSILYQVYYLTASSTYSLIPDSALPGNSSGFTSSPVDISNLNRTTYGTLRTQATLICGGGQCPLLHDWTVTWSQGINVSGTIKQSDQATNVTSGTVAVAVNGSLTSKTGTITNGTWTIQNVTAFQNDVITVFVSGSTSTSRAVGVTKYGGNGDITGMSLYQQHLTLGSDDNPTISNTDIGKYDNSVSGSADIFDDATAGGDLNVCAISGCTSARLLVKLGTTYEPSITGIHSVATYNFQNDGVFLADNNIIAINGSWKNDGAFGAGGSTVIFTATSSTQSIDSTGAATSTFNNLTFGQTSGSASWTLASPVSVSGTLALNFGTLAPGATSTITITGNLSIGANGLFAKSAASTTFSGSGTNTWSDATAGKQDLGDVFIAGSKTIQLGSGVKATNITIGTTAVLDASSNNYSIEVQGNWTNNNSFIPQNGTVNFTATSTGKTITPGASSFYNITFNGVGGNWAFTSSVTSVNDFTITNGIVTLPSATTTIGGTFDSSAGVFMHNNGVIVLNTSGVKIVRPGTSSFYDLTFNGSGSWSLPDANATTSRNLTITAGAVTMPSGIFAISGAFAKNGGSFSANNGTLKFVGAASQSILLGGSSAYNLTFAGTGPFTVSDVNATTTHDVLFSSGATTLPSGVFAIGGSLTSAGGTFSNNSGTVKFNSSTTGNTVNPGASIFYNLVFDSVIGGWTVQSATSTNNTTINNATSYAQAPNTTLAVLGTFTNNVGGAPTTWTNATLFLNSGTSYTLNTKANGGDAYGTLLVGANTNIRMWNSSAVTTTVNATASLYSQNHAGVSGALNIYGAYTSSSEHWSFTTDFDGAIGVARQVNVRIASSSSVTISGPFDMVGSPTASTTVANQGSGFYSLSVTGGTLNAQYYQVASTTSTGLSISGTTTVTSLSNGDFTLSYPSGGSSMTVASSVINQNPALQIPKVRFATTTAVTSGFNVTESGTPTSYWWFRNHYGNFAGESFNNDPGGNPGYIRWDDSGFNITVSGHVYSDHGITPLGSPTCDGVTQNVRLVVGTTTYSTSCNGSTGAYSISSVRFVGDLTFTAYLKTNGGAHAVVVTKTATANITNLDLYQNALIVRHEDIAPLAIADMTGYDSTKDSDIIFTASTSSGATLTVNPNTELLVWSSKTFVPGGNITLQSGGSGDARDGRLYLSTNATFTATGVESHLIGGGLFADTGATFTAANSTLTFTATTTGKSIQSVSPLTFYNLTFNGSGGQWSLDSSSQTTVQNSLALTAGTLIGTGNLDIQNGGVGGGGTFTMTGGTVQFDGTGNFGNSSNWQFKNLSFGSGATASTTKTGSATTTVTGALTIAASDTLNAGSGAWVLSGGGTPFIIGGTFNVQTAPFVYSATTSTSIANTNYALLTLAPAGSGSPTYTLQGGTPAIGSLIIGDGTNAVTVTADTNDPSIALSGSMRINTNAAFVASDIGAFTVGGSWSNLGTFTHSNATVLFNSSVTGNIIAAGNSPFYKLTFDNPSGGWTITQNATSSSDMLINNAAAFTVSPNVSLAVLGTFTNNVGGAPTTWTNATLFLNSGTSYTVNTKSTGADTYGTLLIGPNTNIRMWNSSSATTTVNSTGSLYSQNHANVSGALNIWGAYTRSSGSDYWDYATDFDGTSISGSPRKVNVSIASSSSVTFSGGLLDIIGIATASTTVQNQGSGFYALAVSGGTLSAQYYEVRNTDKNGLNISGTPSVASLSNGDFALSYPSGGSSITVAGSVIDANPLKVIKSNKFATTTGVTSGFNVTEIGSPGSSWKFNLHYGNLAGEAFDNDPGGDPGYIRWDDSASQITISGRVYSDEGTTVSSVCDNTTQIVRLKVQGAGIYTSSCNSSTGAYSIPGVSFNPGDVLTVYLDSNGGKRATNISRDPATNISNIDLYENRVIVRHEDVTPLTIADMSQYDSHQDTDVPFTTTIGSPNTLTLPPNTKLLVWTGKTFAPAGNVTIQSGGATSTAAYDGTLEVQANGIFSAAGTQTHSFGGNFLIDSNASFVSGNSTVTFTATTTGKTITPNISSFYNITFNGAGGNWAFNGSATSTNDLTITTGTVTLPSGTLAVGGSFSNAGGTFLHNNGTLLLTSTATGKTIRVGSSSLYNLTLNGTGGSWSFFDASATTSNNITITNGALTLPTGTLYVGGSFQNAGTFISGSGTINFTSLITGKTILGGSSNFNALTFSGAGGSWIFNDINATASADVTIATGTVTLPSGTLSIGGSLVNNGVFNNASGTVAFIATATGKSITPGGSNFYNLTLNGGTGGWTITQNATSTNNMTISAAASFTQASNTSLAVLGTFTNAVGGAPTTWANSTLFLNSGSSYTINTKSTGADAYGTLLVGPNTKIRMWNSSAATTTVNSTGSLYSQNHGGNSGSLDIWGAYARTTGSDYWDYATDFDGATGVSRPVSVFIASSSSIVISGGLLDMVGASGATTTIANQGVGNYTFSISGGTLNASYFQLRNMDKNGLQFSSAPVISALNNGDLELGVASGTLMTVNAVALDANANLHSTNMRFATSSPATGYNVTLVGTPNSAWTFSSAYGNFAGEAFDSDGVDACGHIRWDDSSCLFVSQSHYRFRNDDGGEGALASNWFSNSWSARKKLVVNNPNATTYTNDPVKVTVAYDPSMKSDFSDLRFTDASGTTTIAYWIESTIASNAATVWVSIPTLPASGSATAYMYFGNAGASDASNGSNTFPFFESFESGSLASYSGDTTLFRTSASFAHNGSLGLDVGTNSGQKTTSGLYQTGTKTQQGQTIRYFQYVDSTQQDEPCTLFGVASSGHNYAVCLEEYPSSYVSLARDVTNSDKSGTILASSTVAYTTGWYEVSINWLTSNTINVTVYDSLGNTFATLSKSDSTYSSGGMGFSYWFMHGGWDFYSSRPYTPSTPTAIFGAIQGNNGATWKVAEDTALSGVNGLTIGQNARLRFSIQNTGADLLNQNYRLQVAPQGVSVNCESVNPVNYSDVPTTSLGCGSQPACMTSSAQFSNQASTSPSLSYPASMSFAAGKIVQDPSNQTNAVTVPQNNATEVEYNFQMTSSAVGNSYCFRTTKGGVDLDNYDHIAQASVLHAPQLSVLSLNNLQNIALTEGSTTTVYATGTVTDLNGYADIVSATSTIYRSGVGASCTSNQSNCYQVAPSSCTFSNCAGNSCTLSCRADLQYFADPTDQGTYLGQHWQATIAVQDSTGLRDTQTTSGVDVLTLYALSLGTGNINFGALAVGQNTGPINATTTVINTGNSSINIQLSGTDLANGGSTIPVGQQKYATSSFTYGTCSVCQFLTGSATNVNVSIPKPTATSTPSTSQVYWGINIPVGTGATTYQGTNTFIAVGG